MAARAALVATGDATKLHAEYDATITALQTLLHEMAEAGYTIGTETLSAEASIGTASLTDAG